MRNDNELDKASDNSDDDGLGKRLRANSSGEAFVFCKKFKSYPPILR